MLFNVSRKQLPVVISLLALFAACSKPANRKEYHSFRTGISVDSFVRGKLTAKQYFTKDTVANGPCFQYTANGQIERWTWYKNGEKRFQADYKNGSPVELSGNPFLYAEQQVNKQLVVQMIYPPNASVITRLYKQSNNNELPYSEYPVRIDDSICHIILGENDSYISDSSHRYILTYFFIDSAKNILRTADTAMEIVPPQYTFFYVGRQTMPLRDSSAAKVN